MATINDVRNQLRQATNNEKYIDFLANLDEPDALINIAPRVLMKVYPKKEMQQSYTYVQDHVHCIVNRHIDPDSPTLKEVVTQLSHDSSIQNPVYIDLDDDGQTLLIE